jgi:hypothetical protein
MGHGAWSATSYNTYSNLSSNKSRAELYSRSSANDRTQSGQEVNIEKIEFRESRDSDEHPLSTPIMVGLDVTGSMGIIPEKLTKGALGTLMNELLQRKPVTDPQLLFMGIGDAVAHDRAPLQVTQFESDNKICSQLTDLWLEGCGGGNDFESYDLAWAFASGKVKTDAWDKRKQKGFLFTIGDEMFPQTTSSDYLKNIFGPTGVQNPTPEILLESAQEQWNVYHIIIAQGNYARSRLERVKDDWKQRLQKRAFVLNNYDYLPHLIISIIALESGVELEEVMGWWNQECVKVLEEAFI